MTVMLDSTVPVMAAIRAALLSDAALSPLISGIYDRAPTPARGSYLTIGDTSADDWSTATEDGQDHMIDVHVWTQPTSQTPETSTPRALMGHVRRILHNATGLTIAMPFNLVTIRVTHQLGPMLDPDGATLHGIVTVRVAVDHP